MKAVIGEGDEPAGRLANFVVEARQQRFIPADDDSFHVGWKLERTLERDTPVTRNIDQVTSKFDLFIETYQQRKDAKR